MNITEELRKWARQFRRVWVDPHSGDLTYITNEHACPPSLDAVRLEDYITAIADRIDAEHESACAEAYGNGVMSVPIALDESQWVRLPVDADGEPVHIGDVMSSRVDYLFDGKPFTVRALVLCEDGWEAADGRFGNRYEPDTLRHHHAPTVEDVLREFAEKIIDSQIPSMHPTYDEAITEYAAKLQLREDA